MSKKKMLTIIVLFLCMVLILPVISQAQQRQRPPEYNEYRKALQIKDLNARIKELERLISAYPNSQVKASFENALLDAKIGLCTDVDGILKLQGPRIESTKGFDLIFQYYYSSLDIIEHSNLTKFDKKKVTHAVTEYAQKGLKLAADPEFVKSLPEQQRPYIKRYGPLLYIAVAKAYLNEGSPKKALETLDNFQKKGGMKDKDFYYVFASTQEQMDKNEEAFANFFNAAVENYKDSVNKAKTLYMKLNGSLEGFNEKLEAKQRELPYHPESFYAPQDWKGKTVLAELFTGSECPPCVGADLAFDGLIDAVGPKYVAILEYHLPIPRPDPIMNHATKKRQDYYGVRSTPLTFFDGERKHSGGGIRSMSEMKYNQYSDEIKSRLSAVPAVKIEVNAALEGDVIKVKYTADKLLNGADYNIALVQKEEVYHGGNGIAYHKMVVREIVTAEAAKTGHIDINPIETEKAAEKHLVDFEKARNFQFQEKHFKIDRTKLQVVFFIQDKNTKEVYNATVSDVAFK